MRSVHICTCIDVYWTFAWRSWGDLQNPGRIVLKCWDTDTGCIREMCYPRGWLKNHLKSPKFDKNQFKPKVNWLQINQQKSNRINSNLLKTETNNKSLKWTEFEKCNPWNRHQLNQQKSSEINKMGQQINLTPEQYQPWPDPFTPAKTLRNHLCKIDSVPPSQELHFRKMEKILGELKPLNAPCNDSLGAKMYKSIPKSKKINTCQEWLVLTVKLSGTKTLLQPLSHAFFLLNVSLCYNHIYIYISPWCHQFNLRVFIKD